MQFCFLVLSVFTSWALPGQVKPIITRPRIINYYCQNDTKHIIALDSLIYDSNSLLLKVYKVNHYLKVTTEIKYTYDEKKLLNRITSSRIWPDNSMFLDTVFLTYKNDMLASERKKDYTTSYEYNQLGQLVSLKNYGNTWSVTFTIKYDENGNKTVQEKNGKPDVMYFYKNNLLQQETQNSNGVLTITYFRYNEKNQLVEKEINGQIVEENEYNGDFLLSQMTADYSLDSSIERPCAMKWIRKYRY